MDKNNLIVFENNQNVYDINNSLQDNFKKFLNMRKELRKNNIKENNNDEYLAIIESRKSFRDDYERMEILRMKFVERALSYLGIPYGKKYLTDDNPLYKSPLFLDCCGLVRQCINDLKEEFGFMLGRWNQAYQFDILPQCSAIKFSEMKPGDLIFYEAVYYKEKGWKLQPHNLVHVEIFYGDENHPERSIAARDRYGVVEVNDTYQFTSENYYDIKYHYRSIDPWLRGIHKSFCEEHKWHDTLLDNKPNKFSLFNSDNKEEENESAEELI